MVPIREVLVHGLSGGRADGVCILSNLVCDIEQRDHNSNRANDLSNVSKISKIHGFQLQPRGRLRSIAPTYVNSLFELVFVLRGVEMALRFCDESVVVDLPKLVAADPNVISCSCVGADQRPVECGSVCAWLEFVE